MTDTDGGGLMPVTAVFPVIGRTPPRAFLPAETLARVKPARPSLTIFAPL